jgi:alpha-mannosidase
MATVWNYLHSHRPRSRLAKKQRKTIRHRPDWCFRNKHLGPRRRATQLGRRRSNKYTPCIPTDIVTEKEDGIFILGNGKIEVTIQGGQILSLIDIELNREIIPKGQRANRLILYDDQPLYWDAWDVEIYHLETPKELGLGKTSIVDRGPLRVGLLVQHQISEESWIKTTISLDAYIPSIHSYATGFKDPLTYLQFECEVDWHENRRFLKAEFPVDIYSDMVFPL